ncbi:tellurium resistance protein TerW [Atlantibacter hermannii]|uniref:tellurium resistance protein TerW n=1 Tax=Atlantibacter hermannii TaxID=565 RepID=UPI0013787265|nr:tellurium resistance protein TerW [Atlantibacter hermannii]NBD00523.1 tellurium resistance protein TerW [Atlantibacter hermannii]
MQLSTRQARVYMLATLLGPGKPVPAAKIIATLACSEPTLTRVLKELREFYSAEIKYSKANHTYQLTHAGLLDKKQLRRMNEALNANAGRKTSETVSHVSLDKEKKKAVSLSLKMSILQKIELLALLSNITRSEAVEMIVGEYADRLIREIKAEQKAGE